MISHTVVTTEPGMADRARVSAGRAGLRFAHICCFLLALTLVWSPHWPLYRFDLAPPPYGILDTVLAPADVLFIGIVVGWGLALISGQDRIELSPYWISGPLLIFTLAGGLAVVGALDQPTALRFAIRAAGLAVLYLYVHRGLATGRLLPAMLTMWLVPGLAVNGLLAIAQSVHQNPLGLSWLGEPDTLRTMSPTPVILVHGTRLLRAFGLLPHPNALGGLLAAALPLVAGLLLHPAAVDGAARTSLKRWAYAMRDAFLLLSAALMLAGVVLSFSRSAWLGLLCGGLYLIAWHFIGHRHAILAPYRRRAVLLIGAIGLVTAGLFMAEWSAVSVRLQPASNRMEQTSIEQRLSLLDLSFRVITWRPVTGVGGDNYVLAANRFLSPSQRSQITDVPVHNTYLLAEAELGPLGGVTWLILMLAPLLYLARQRWKRPLAGTSGEYSAVLARPRILAEGVGQAAMASGLWTPMAAAASQPRHAIGSRHAGWGDQARRETAAIVWQGLAGCSLIVVAVVGLADWYMWGDGPGNEPVAVVWVLALALLTAPAGDPYSYTPRRAGQRRLYLTVAALALLAVLATAFGGGEYLFAGRTLPKIMVNKVNINVGGQTQNAIALRLRPFSLKQRFRVIALITPGRPPILVPAYKLGYRIDNGLTAWRAYHVGHSGPLRQRLLQLARTLLGGARVDIAQRVDETMLDSYLFRLQGALNRPSRPGLPGRALNVAAAQRQITHLLLYKVGAFRVHLTFLSEPALTTSRSR